MGRGRAKAKQTKVARNLKYRSVETDFAELERELRGEQPPEKNTYDDPSDRYEEIARRYADYDDIDYDEDDRR